MTSSKKVKGNQKHAVVKRPYNTRSNQAPQPSKNDALIPPVRGKLTDRFARVRRKFEGKRKTFELSRALKQETDFYETRARHLKVFMQSNTKTCLGVRLADLRARNITDSIKLEAEVHYQQMLKSHMKPCSTSGIWVEDVAENPQWLVIYAGQHQTEKGFVRDGFHTDEMEYMMEQTQEHMRHLDIECPRLGADSRHLESSKYPFIDYDVLSDEEDESIYKKYTDPINEADVSENIGLRHDMHCWHEQAHNTSDPLPSSDLRGKKTAHGARIARSYILATEPQRKYLDILLKTFAPNEYAELKASSDAGRWYVDDDMGCTLGLSTVYKLQVGVHLDKNDWELCMIVCGGNFRGGHLYLPDLNLCLAYNPGDVVIFRSPYLFHGIGKWTPGPMVPQDKCTPGRVSWVHLTHRDVHEKLKDKPKGFFRKGGWTGVGITAGYDDEMVHVF